MEIIGGKVEEKFSACLASLPQGDRVAIVDPPRGGLSLEARNMLSGAKNLNHLLYLSCHPQTLVQDLQYFVVSGWQIIKIIPFDFFPRTRHMETLVLLKPNY